MTLAKASEPSPGLRAPVLDMSEPNIAQPGHWTRERASTDRLWISLVLFVVLSIAFLLPILPNDYWWHVRIGQDTIRTGSIPTVDALSYTQAGRPVVYHSWLSAVIF